MLGSETAARRNLELVVEYDGTKFSGWQVQPDQRTVQGEIERAIAEITGERLRVAGASRTDAGVHALGQVSSFPTLSALSCDRLLRGLNAVLPADVSVRRVREVPEAFHARFSARGKHYRYRIFNHTAPSPLERDRSWHVAQPLDLDAMQAAAREMVGEHDFSALACRAGDEPGAPERSAVRTLFSLEVSRGEDLPRQEEEAALVNVDVVGDGFLYKMVRTIVGTLSAVGSGKLAPAAIGGILCSKERRRAGPTAPPQGLFLVRVFYPSDKDNVPFAGAWEGVDREDQHYGSRHPDPRQHQGVRGAEGQQARSLL